MVQKNNQSHKIASLVILVIILAVTIFGYFNYYTIYDDILLFGYHPPSAIATLASQDTMTSYAREIFYINYPQLMSLNRFYLYCPNKDPSQSIVLGCYHGDEDGIYLLKVTDPTLYGLEQVTAAHEMLHGIYDRLSSSVRNNLDHMLMNYYLHDLKNPVVKAQIAIYKKTEPGYVENEMNSTFGTECKNLPPSLNNYYRQFFTNRLEVVNYNDKYQYQLTSRENTVSSDDNQLSSWSSQINQITNTLNSDKNQLNSLNQTMNALQQAGQTYRYNQLVNQYNSLVNSYNNLLNNSYKPLIKKYNALVVVRNQVSDQLFQLQNTLTNAYQSS